jgi:hypothetical protein
MNTVVKCIVAFCLLAGHAAAAAQWVVGYSAESCTTTCSKISKTCSLPALQAVTTSSAFAQAVSGATQLGKSDLVTSSSEFCTGGINSWAFATAPASMQYPLYVKDPDSDVGTYQMTNSCYFPEGGVTGDCDTVYSVPPAQRFCPCV